MRILLFLLVLATLPPRLDAGPAERLEALRRWDGGAGWTMDGRLSWRSSWHNPGAEKALPGSHPAEKRLLLHSGRLLIGAHSTLASDSRFDWSLAAGGTLAENSLYAQRILTPEGRVRLDFRPLDWLGIGGQARYGWRLANAFASDSLRRRDLIAALNLRLVLPSFLPGELQLQGGNRRIFEEDFLEDQRFGRVDLRMRPLRDLRLEFFGESQGYGRDSLDYELQRNTAGLRLSGRLPWGIRQEGQLSRRYREGRQRWLVRESLLLEPHREHRLALRLSSDWSDWQERSLYRRWIRGTWQWLPLEWVGARLQFRSDLRDFDEEVLSHERSIGLGPWFKLRPGAESPLARMWPGARDLSLDGNLDLGYLESSTWGKGLEGRLQADALLPVYWTKDLTSRLQNQLQLNTLRLQEAEDLAQRLGRPVEKELQAEVNNRLSLSSEASLDRWRLGHRVHWQRQAGSELLFELDSLRNTLGNEIWLRMPLGSFQHLRLSGMHLRHTLANPMRAVEYRLTGGWQLQLERLRAGGEAVWRPARRAIKERCWLNAFLDGRYRKLRARLSLQFAGDPKDWFNKDTQCWLQVERSLW